jgi:voltage-gated potassium channel Kch
MKNHIIICGLGTIGFKVFQLLIQLGEKVTIISDRSQDELQGQIQQANAVFILGDARSDTLLLQAGIIDAKGIMVLTDQDMANVSIIMDARQLNPHIKIVSRLFDTQLGLHIAKAFSVQQIFSASEIAAPIFVSEIYAESSLAYFTVEDETYFVTEKKAKRLSKFWHSLATEMPNNDVRLTQDSAVRHLVAYPSKLSRRKLVILSTFSKWIKYFRSPVFANFRLFLKVLLGVITFATVVMKFEMHLSFLDAFYFVTTTVTTVGYGDINFSKASPQLKIFGCMLMFGGATALAVLFSSITEIILTKKLSSLLGGRPVPSANHIVIVGSGHVSRRLIENFIENDIDVVIIDRGVIDKSRDNIQDLKRQVAVVEGNPRSVDTLMRANVQHAKAIFVITEDDIENLSVSLAAKTLNPHIINIVHVFDSRLDTRLEKELSVTKVLSVSNIAAPYYVAAMYDKKIVLALTWNHKLIYLSHDKASVTRQSSRIKSNKSKSVFKHIHIHEMPLK